MPSGSWESTGLFVRVRRLRLPACSRLPRRQRSRLAPLGWAWAGSPASSLLPSFPPSGSGSCAREPAAGLAAPVPRPALRAFTLGFRRLESPASGGEGPRWGAAGGLVGRTSPSAEVREGLFGPNLHGASKFLSVERQLGCFTCRLEHNFLMHHPQCHTQDKVQRSSLQ